MMAQNIITLFYLAVVLKYSTSAHESSIRGHRGRKLQQPGPECAVSSSIVCMAEVDQGTYTRDCTDLRNGTPLGETCGNLNIMLTYTVCNEEADSTIILKNIGGVEAKFKGARAMPMNTSRLTKTECKSKNTLKMINTCQPTMWASLKVEGYLEGYPNDRDKYCYSWTWYNIRMRTHAPTHAPSEKPSEKPTDRLSEEPAGSQRPTGDRLNTPFGLPPTKFPTKEPTKDPTRLPAKIPSKAPVVVLTKVPTEEPTKSPIKVIAPVINLVIQCYGQIPGSSVYVTCDKIGRITEQHNCRQNLRYEYTIENLSNHPIRAQSIVVYQAGIFLHHISLLDNIEPSDKFGIFTSPVTEDLCTLGSGEPIKTSAIAIAVDVTGKIQGTDSKSYTFNVPHSILQWLVKNVDCFINDGKKTTCNEHLSTNGNQDTCTKDVTFEYIIENIGPVCHYIESISSAIQNGYTKHLSLDTKYSCQERTFCTGTGNEWYLEDKRTVDLCAMNGNIPFNININSASMKVGYYKFPTGIGPTMSPATTTMPPVITTISPTLTVSPSAHMSTKCLQTPSQITFVFGSRLCKDSVNQLDNNQRRDLNERLLKDDKKTNQKKNKVKDNVKDSNQDINSGNSSNYFSCADYCELTRDSTIIVTDTDKHEELFNEGGFSFGDNLTIKPSCGKLSSDILVIIKDRSGRISQKITIHTSCSKPISTGDTFGALELVGWKNNWQGMVTV